jgi:CheY-like chemotaxis protein/acyl-CoA thioesterase FadM
MKNRILLIDDDKDVLRSLENLLKKDGYDVTAIDDSSKAIEAVKKVNFGLVITDIRMPNLNGIETIKKIKEYQNRSDSLKSEFMVITGYADDDAPKESALLGIANFVIKPFDADVFLETVKKCLEGKKIELPKAERVTPKKSLINFPDNCFLIEKTVLLRDTNLMGNTYFANYIMWQGEVREAILMTHPNFAEEMQKNKHIKMITHSIYHRFVQETTFCDIVQIKMTTREIKHCSLVLVFRYYNKITGAFLGEGWQRLTFADLRTGSLATIPNFIRELAIAIKEDTEHV